MDPFEIQNCLDSFTILVDTREQDTERSRARYSSFGCPFRRQALSYGDYSYDFILHGKSFHGTDKTVFPLASVERKMSLDELAMCFCQERKRFKTEFDRAKIAHAAMYLLVENASWENLLAGKYRNRFHPNAYKASITAWMVRYSVPVIFCKEETSGQLIKEILYRDLKERLEKGEFDDERMDPAGSGNGGNTAVAEETI